MKEPLKTRLKRLRVMADLSQTDVANALGLRPQSVQQWESGRTEPRGKRVDALADLYKCSASYILFGDDDSGSSVETVEAGPDVQGFIPVVSWIIAGQWKETEEHHIGPETEFVACPRKHGKNTFALRVVGDSMTSVQGVSFPEGYIIFVDPDQDAVAGEFVVAKIIERGEKGVTFKQLAMDGSIPYLRPLNPQHRAMFEEFEVIGKVIGTYMPL